MIQSFQHKGLQQFWETGSKKGIIPAHVGKLERVLDALNEAQIIEDLNIPGFRLHRLTGDLTGNWSIRVNGNWRVTFWFLEDAEDVDYIDYH